MDGNNNNKYQGFGLLLCVCAPVRLRRKGCVCVENSRLHFPLLSVFCKENWYLSK